MLVPSRLLSEPRATSMAIRSRKLFYNLHRHQSRRAGSSMRQTAAGSTLSKVTALQMLFCQFETDLPMTADPLVRLRVVLWRSVKIGHITASHL